MARQAKAIPKIYREDGVWCVLDIDGQHQQVDEYEALEQRYTAGERLTAAETARREELRQAMGELLVARVCPMSHAQYEAVQGQKFAAAFGAKPGVKSAPARANINIFANELALDVIAERVTELGGYTKTEAVRVDPESGEVLEARTVPLVTGAEAVAFFRSDDCPDTESAVADALFALVTKQSVLEAGLGKWWASRRASSPATTRPSAGDAPAAIPSTSTPATT